MEANFLMRPWHALPALLLVLLLASAGHRVSVAGTPAPADTTKTTAAPAEQPKAATGLVHKLFKRIAGFLAEEEKKHEEKGITSHKDKKSYEHRYTHQQHRDIFESESQLGFKDYSNPEQPLDTMPYKTGEKFKLSAEVFGWHPYWVGDAYKAYNFSLLSTLAYFSYELDAETGGYLSIHDWDTTPIIDLAHADGCKVLLTVTNFGASANSTFLESYKSQQNLIAQLKQLLAARGADGVCIDFEGVPESQRDDLGNFMTDLGTALHQENSDYVVSMAIYPIDVDDIYDFSVLDRCVDQFVMMGYEYYGSGSEDAGPLSPLQSGKLWWKYNLETSIDSYLESGVTPSKLLVAFPYYGALWETQSLEVPSKAKDFIGYRSYQYITDTFTFDSVIDSTSWSAYYAYVVENGQERQCWFESVLSLREKYAYVKQKKIGGIGIWALGYDNGRKELWDLLAEQFGSGENRTDTSTAAGGGGAGQGGGTADSGQEAESVLESLLQYKALVYVLIVYLLMLIATAYGIALFNCQIRAYLLGGKMMKLYAVAFIFVIILIALRLFPVSDEGFLSNDSLLVNYSLLILFGMIAGGIVTWLVNKIVIRRDTNIP